MAERQDIQTDKDELEAEPKAELEAEPKAGPKSEPVDELDRLEDIGRKTVKVAASAVLATTLVGALSEPPHTEMMSLPEPTPIVQIYQAVDDDPVPDEDDEDDENSKRWQRVLKILKMLLVALALAGTIAFGALKGCAGIAGTLLLPPDDEQQEQTTTTAQTEDERGVAVAG